jgi:hypothetical protein
MGKRFAHSDEGLPDLNHLRTEPMTERRQLANRLESAAEGIRFSEDF